MARTSAQNKGGSSRKGGSSGAKNARGGSSGNGQNLRGNSSRSTREPEDEASLAEPGAGRDIAGVALAVVAVVSFIAVVSPSDAPVTSAISQFYHLGFGLGAYVLPFVILAGAVCLFLRDRSPLNARTVIGAAIIFVSILGMLSLQVPYTSLFTSAMFTEENLAASGGYVGAVVASFLQELFGKTVSMVILVGLVIVGLVVIGFSISGFLRSIQGKLSAFVARRREAREARKVEVNQEPWGDSDALTGSATAETKPMPGRTGRKRSKGGAADDDGSAKTTFLGSRETTVLDRGSAAARAADADDDDDDPIVDISDQLAAEREAERAETVLIPVKDRFVEVQEPMEVPLPGSAAAPAPMAAEDPLETLHAEPAEPAPAAPAAASASTRAVAPAATTKASASAKTADEDDDDGTPPWDAPAAGATTILPRSVAADETVDLSDASVDDTLPSAAMPGFLNRSGDTVLLDSDAVNAASGKDKRPGRASRATKRTGSKAASGGQAAKRTTVKTSAPQGAHAAAGGAAAAAATAAPTTAASASTASAATKSSTKAAAKSPASTPAKGTDTSVRPLPPMSMLRHNPNSANAAASDKELEQTAQALQDTLAEFNLHAKVVGWISGPTVTTFKVQPGEGERVSRITNLEDDIALSLATSSVRIFAPIPDTSLVGIEIPNRNRQNVYLADVLPYVKGGPLELAIGRDSEGTPVVADLAKMPHLLIAGTTGSGKSVMINSIVITLLMRTQPEDVRLIMIDPKRVELAGYNGLPHLYVPVVTEAKQAASALQWAVSEMERRLKVFEKLSVRKISTYNEKQAAGEWADRENPPQKMPYLVIIIDELSDLMMVAGKDVEASIVRIAQLGRAAGIHLIVATQRPSANVVTGLIKANITNRIAFNVATGVDSRVIIDQSGAEKLTGLGDMLFSKVGWGKPKRIQGCYVSDEEIASVVDFVKEHGQAEYHEEILSAVSPATVTGGSGADADEEDPLLWNAAHIVVESQLGSTSGLQRRLKVGYARAGRIMDMLEEKGIVGPPDGSKPREVLVDEEGLAELEALEGQLSQGEGEGI